MTKKSILCVVGTRPEAIKMAPVIANLKKRDDLFDTVVMATAQHRALLDQALNIFNIRPDVDLDLMRPGQTVAYLTSGILQAMDRYFKKSRPEVVLAQGDTTTVMTTAMACFYEHIPFGHVEAGLRTWNLDAPYPEEFNRRVISIVARYHFAPTQWARNNLLKENVDESLVHVTGNPIVDAVQYILDKTIAPSRPFPAGQPFIMMTCHRRESFGAPLLGILEAVRTFARLNPDLMVWYPVHPNPNITGPAHRILGGLPNVLLSEPLDYIAFLHALKDSILLLTDSGGIQEEGVTLGKPVLVLREVTERPEAVEAGGCRLVGTNPDSILETLKLLMSSRSERESMSQPQCVFGDGHAAERIVSVLAGQL